MTPRTDPSPKPRAPLNRDLVLRGAIGLTDAGGIESLTMRKLGRSLGVEAMSLYNHVANKDDILAGIVDLVVSEIELPSAAESWQAAIRTCAVSAHDALRRHPWACSLIMSPAGVGPARFRYMDWILGQLREAGFSPELTYHAYHALDSHVLGVTLWEAGHSIDTDDLEGFVTSFLEQLPVDEYPHFVEHVHEHLAGSHDGVRGFEFGLELILDGLERMRVAA